MQPFGHEAILRWHVVGGRVVDGVVKGVERERAGRGWAVGRGSKSGGAVARGGSRGNLVKIQAQQLLVVVGFVEPGRGV